MTGVSYGTIQSALTAAVQATVGDDKNGPRYCYVQDFDDTTCVYYTDEGTFQIPYSMDGGGNVSLIGDPVVVRPVTKYVPVGEVKGLPAFESRSMPAAPRPRVEVVAEPLTYERHAPVSYFRDLALAELRDDREAAARIARHTVEMRVEQEKYERRARSQMRDAGFDVRVNPNTTAGQGGNFALPLWLNQYFATAPRAIRVLADMMPAFALPTGAHSINLPRITTGNQARPVQDLEANASQDVTDAGVNATVTVLAGSGAVALQLLEQSPAGAHLDWAFFKDLTEDYDSQLEYNLLFGSGTGENIAGLTTSIVPSSNKVVDNSTPGSTAGAVLWTDISQAISKVADNRNLPPEVVLMRTGRWTWLGQQGDAQGRPLITPGDMPDVMPGDYQVDHTRAVGAAFGSAVWLDDAIPNTLGSGGNQDTIVTCRPADMILFEGTPKTMVAMEPLSGTMGVRLQLRNSVAALTGRYPSGVGTVSGTFMAWPSGW